MINHKLKSRLLLSLICVMWMTSFVPVKAAETAAAAPVVPSISGGTVITGVAGPKSDDIANAGDPGASMTGTVNDVTIADSKAGLTLADLANQAGQNKIAINFVWTLVCGFLVMFMQAGFAIVEIGLCRAQNDNHTMLMDLIAYGVRRFAYYVCRFAIPM